MAQDPVYFAAKSPEDTAANLMKKADSFFSLLRSNAYFEKMQKMWKAYHGVYNNGSYAGSSVGSGHTISFSGEQGEYVQLPINHFRNLAQHIFVMITANRPVMDARAANTDYKSMAQTYLANGILEYYMREKHLEDYLKKATEMSIVLGAGFVKMEWNATAGEAYDIDEETGVFNYEGELEFSNLSPFDVVFDGTKETWDHNWIMCRSFKNRFDLIAKYPELSDKLMGMQSKSEQDIYRIGSFSNDDTDDIAVYEFYHKRTEALPEGRYMLFVDSDAVLLDTRLPYRTIPVFRISPSDIMGTPYGYSPMFDIFPIQEGINSLYSTIMTNQSAFGVQNLFVPRGADISVNSLEGGMNIIEGNAKPEPLQMTQTPPEVFEFLQMLIQASETISGVNSVARGNPEASLKSGTALALVQSMSLQFISGLQHSYVKLIEDVGTSLIGILKEFSTTPKVIALVGKNNRTLLKEFTGEQISSINRVMVDVGNPLSRSIAGRVQMAEQMLQMNMLKNPQQYIQILNTGRLDTAFEGEMDELLLIRRENENLMEGTEVLVSPLDAHRTHILEHKAVLADPDLRTDVELVKNVLNHIQEHMDSLRNTDPDLLALIGEQALAPIAQPQEMGASPIDPGQPAMPPNSKNPDIMAQPGQPAAGMNKIQGPGVVNQTLPQPASPAPPFQNMPTDPSQMIPQ